MTERTAPRHYRNGGLILFFLINLIGWSVIIADITTASSYDQRTGNSVTMAQAAYITALWTRSIASSAGLISFDIVIVGLAICARITALHQAVIWAAKPRD